MEFLKGSRSLTVALTWSVLALFFILLITGWKYLLEPSIGDGFIAATIAFILATLAVLATRQIGFYRGQSILKNEPPKWSKGWQQYIFVAILSSIGTLNAAFVIFESRAILRHDISVVRTSYDKLLNEGESKLPPPGYTQKLNQINQQLNALEQEVVNPNGGNYCGVGAYAIRIIREIQSIIPQYHIIKGSAPLKGCQKNDPRARTIYDAYASMAHDMLKKSSDFAPSRGAERIIFLDDLRNHAGKYAEQLARLEGLAAGYGGTSSFPMTDLYAARDQFNADRERFLSLAIDATLNVDSISMLQSDKLSSYAATFRLMADRLKELNTWIYLLLALGIDFAIIYLFTAIFVQFGQPYMDNESKEENFPKKFNHDPKFLWVPPVQPSR